MGVLRISQDVVDRGSGADCSDLGGSLGAGDYQWIVEGRRQYLADGVE